MTGRGAIGGMVGWYGGNGVIGGRLDRSKDLSTMMRSLGGASATGEPAVGWDGRRIGLDRNLGWLSLEKVPNGDCSLSGEF